MNERDTVKILRGEIELDLDNIAAVVIRKIETNIITLHQGHFSVTASDRDRVVAALKEADRESSIRDERVLIGTN